MADRAYLLARRGAVELHASAFILGEVDRVLHEKFGWEEDRVGRAVAQVRRVPATVHEPEESVDVIEDDPTDNRILECALAARADFIVTGTRSTCCRSAPSGAFPSLG